MSEAQQVTPQDADNVVKQEKNSVYNPAISTEEVAEALGVCPEEAYELLDDAPRPESKEVGNTHIWW